MGNRAGRKIFAVVPWIALVVVGAFALMLLAERRERPAGDTADEAKNEARALAHAAVALDVQAKKAADQAVDQAFQDLEAARARGRALEAERDAATARAETAEARLAASEAEAEALGGAFESAETTLGRMQESLEKAAERIVSLEERRAVAEDRVRRWLRDAAQEDLEVLARAFEDAEKAKKQDLEHLAELLAADPTLASAAAKILPAVKPSDAGDAAVIAALVAPEAHVDDVAPLGAHLVRPAVVGGVLEKASPEIKLALLDALAVHAASIADDDRAKVSASVTKVVSDPALRVPATRLAGVLRLEGAPFVKGLGADDAALRAASAYALSRAPDLEKHEAEAKKALPALLKDDQVAVRLAGVMLLEALLGEDVSFDPEASSTDRAKALEAITSKL